MQLKCANACLPDRILRRVCNFPGGPGYSDSVFVDDAIRIEKYFQELKGSADINHLDISTNGSLSIHINGNTDGNGNRFERWLDYAVGW